MNKADLVDGAGLAEAQRLLHQAAPHGRILPTIQAAPPLALLDFDRDTDSAATTMMPPVSEHGIRRWLYRRTTPFDRALLEHLLHRLPPGLLRLKGWCRLAGEAQPYLLQMTGARWRGLLYVRRTGWSLTQAAALPAALLAGDTLLIGLGTPEMPAEDTLAGLFDSVTTAQAALA